jgi:hypothetical protein
VVTGTASQGKGVRREVESKGRIWKFVSSTVY